MHEYDSNSCLKIAGFETGLGAHAAADNIPHRPDGEAPKRLWKGWQLVVVQVQAKVGRQCELGPHAASYTLPRGRTGSTSAAPHQY